MHASPRTQLQFVTVGAAARHPGMSQPNRRKGAARSHLPARRDNRGDPVYVPFDETEELRATLSAQAGLSSTKNPARADDSAETIPFDAHRTATKTGSGLHPDARANTLKRNTGRLRADVARTHGHPPAFSNKAFPRSKFPHPAPNAKPCSPPRTPLFHSFTKATE